MIKNLKPVALLCTDFRIISKALANRFQKHWRIRTSRNVYQIARLEITCFSFVIQQIWLYDLSFGLIAIDREKAFDRVDHGYLLETLKAFGFGRGMASWINLLYTNASCSGKGGGGAQQADWCAQGNQTGMSSVWAPVHAGYRAFVVPDIRHRLSGLIVPGTISANAGVKVSAYADDHNSGTA